MVEEHRNDIGKYIGQLIMAALVGAVSCILTLATTTSKLDARVTNVEHRMDRIESNIIGIDRFEDHMATQATQFGDLNKRLDEVLRRLEKNGRQ